MSISRQGGRRLHSLTHRLLADVPLIAKKVGTW